MALTQRSQPTLKEEEDIDSCSLCLKPFTNPKILLCFHSFCQHCLKFYTDKHARNGKFPCPLCVTECLLPPSGVEELQTNFYIKAVQTRQHTAANTPCEVCDEGIRAERNCLECDQNLCQNCGRSHLKMTSSRDHHLASLTDRDATGGHVTNRSFCDKHKGDELSFYCRKCNIPICLRCKVTSHENHASEDLTDVATETRALLSEMLQNARNCLPKLHTHLNDVTRYGEHIETETSKLREEITIQTKKLHEAIEALSKKMLDEVGDEGQVERARIQTRRKFISATANSLSIQLHAANQVVSFGSDADITRNKDHLAEQLDRIAKREPPSDMMKLRMEFLPADNTDGSIREMFGELSKTRNPIEDVKVEEFAAFAVDSSFKAISCICPTSDGMAWIALGWTADAHLFYRHGLKVKTHVVSNTIDFIAQDMGDSLYMSSNEQRSVGKPGEGFILNHFADFPGYHPRGVTITAKGDILVCLAQTAAFQDYRPAHKNKVVHLSADGKQVTEYGADGKLFFYPLRVTVNVNDDIIVSDSKKRCVVILRPSGEPKATYSGSVSAGLKNTFEPRGLACDSRGHIMIADSANHAIHMIDHMGKFMQLLVTEREGLFGPYAVAMDNDDCLWVGGRDADVKVFKLIWS